MTGGHVMHQTAGAVAEFAGLGGGEVSGLRGSQFEQPLELLGYTWKVTK